MSVRVAVFEGTSRVGAVAENIAMIRTAAANAAHAGAKVLVTPELFISGYDPAAACQVDGQSHRDALAQLAAEFGIWVAGATVEWSGERKHILGTLHRPDGSVALAYRKRMLIGVETAFFERGEVASPVVVVGGIPTSLAICFDVEFPELVRENARAGAELLLVPTAVPLRQPVDDVPPAYDTTLVPRYMVPVRALESQLTIAYANHGGAGFAGFSVIAGPFGSTTVVAPGEKIALADVDEGLATSARLDTPYLEEAQRLAAFFAAS